MLPLTKMISPKRRKKFHKKNVYSLYSPSQWFISWVGHC
jgi:hypothetical protein